MRKFFRRLHDGSFHPDVFAFSSLCRKAKYKDYLLRQKDHFSQLVVDLLPSRQIVLDVAALLPEGLPSRIRPPLSSSSSDRHRRGDAGPSSRQRVLSRAGVEYYRALAEVRQDVADDGETSSDDEAFPEEAPLFLKARGCSSSDPAALDGRGRPSTWREADSADEGRGRQLSSLGEKEVDRGEGVDAGAAAATNAVPRRRRLCVEDTWAPQLDPVSEDDDSRNASISTSGLAPALSEDQYKRMLKKRRKRRKMTASALAANGFRPDWDTEGTDLNDIIKRTEISISTVPLEVED